MTKLDRYIVRQFVLAIIFSLIAFTMIFVLVDLMEHLDDFIDHRVGLGIISAYYFYFTPEILKLMTPVAVLLSSLFVTGRMSNQNEIVAIKSVGVNIYRILAPYLLVSSVLCAVLIYFNGWIVPDANHKKFQIEQVYLKKHLEGWWKYNIFMLDTRTRVVSIGYYDDASVTATKVSVQEFADTNLTYLVKRYDAQSMTYDTSRNVWILHNTIYRNFSKTGEEYQFYKELVLSKMTFKPKDIEQKELNPSDMDFEQLKRFIDLQKKSGNDTAKYEVDYYSKISFPFAALIVVFFGVPLSARKRRSGLALEFGLSLLISFIYLIFIKLSQVLGYDGIINPLLTAWLANIVFFGAGIYNTVKVER